MVAVPLEDWITSAISKEQMQPFGAAKNRSSILAAAGSGKTRTLVHLLAHDLCSGIPASGIVAFTFTEKAAEELLARIHSMQNQYMPTVDLSGIFIGTIHSWCIQYLHSQTAFYNVTPIDELHVDALAARLYSFLKLEEVYDRPFPKAIQPFLGDLEVYYNEHLPLQDVPQDIEPPLTAFLALLSQNRLLTFGGMIRSAAEHLELTGPLSELQSLYVDEYQDVNPAQTTLIHSMLPPTGQLRVVGDDLQSIYNWRGSDVTRIINFPQEFAPADVFRLSTNYRSTPELVALANGVADDIVLRDPEKVMRPGREPCRHKVVHWISTNSEAHQAETIASIVKRFHSTGVPYPKMAILMRSVVSAGMPIYERLRADHIPVQCPILSRSGGFIDELLLPIMKWLCTEQIGPRTREEEQEQYDYARSLWSSVSQWLSVDDAESVFWAALNRWHDLLRQQESRAYNVRGCLYEFLNKCGVRVAPADADLMVGLGLSSQIIRGVEEIHRRRLGGQMRRSAVGVITEAYYALLRHRKSFGESLAVNQHAEGVVLTTVHQAKGLEWPIVCLPMLDARRFPLPSRRFTSRFPPHVTDRYGTRLDDERRLFYVAVTRARERLFLLDTAALSASRRSVFLRDLEGRGLLPEQGLPDPSDATWSIARQDLANAVEPPTTVSLSDLLLYLECPYQFGLRRIAGIEPAVGDELGFGKGLHELLQRRADSGKQWTDAKVNAQVNKYVHLPMSSAAAELRARVAIGHRITVLDELGAFPEEIWQELPVEMYMEGGMVTGMIDFVYAQPDGYLVVRDWKSNIHDTFIARYTRQVQIYVHALRLQGHSVSRAELVDVAASAEARRLIVTDVDISEPTITKLTEQCQQALHAIREGTFHPTPSVHVCASCDVRAICAVRTGDTSG